MTHGSTPTCEYRVEGNPDGPTLVFIHGWPDNASLWHWQVAELGTHFRCVLLTLPNFGEQAVNGGGFDFPELVARVAATIHEVQPEGRVGLVTHDWGAYLGYLLEQAHPGRIERIAALDIGGHLGRPDLKSALMIMGYQWALIACWLVGGVVPALGRSMSRGVARVIRVPSRQRSAIRSRYNYPYFYLWRNLLLPWKRRYLLQNYRPGCPVLFLWGERKPVMFHSDKWLRMLAAAGGHSEGISGAGHWFMETHPEIVNDRIREWFSAPVSESGAAPQSRNEETES